MPDPIPAGLQIIKHRMPARIEARPFFQGTNRSPDGRTLEVDHRSLLRDGERWLPVMGEIHYSRVPAEDWRAELLKMRAGGIDIIASYVFWIHHEEHEGEFDWTGVRNLRKFVEICKELDFPIIVRCGPWCHGEVRNGGLPDWILTKGFKTRSDDPKYLQHARNLYSQIELQLRGLLFKDGGPVVGIQIENEYFGPAEHLITLRNIAREVGLDVPLYTRTGWPSTSTPMPFGELLLLFGGYPDGFWDRHINKMPGHFWKAFRFELVRTDEEVGADMLGTREGKDESDTPQYPYLTCEIGGGMEQSYHRRVLIDPQDILSVVTTKLGGGSNLPGYYMYHGGTNPEGKFSTLQESQATKYWNDVPVKSYDFQAPIGQYGQIREPYFLLRRIHTFLHDFGSELAEMTPSLPAIIPQKKDDLQTLRFAIRSNGKSGYLFVNNYQRLESTPAKTEVQFEIELPDGKLRFPEKPITIPADTSFIFPFNLDLSSVKLIYATAQLLARAMIGGIEHFYFAQIPGIEAIFAFADGLRTAQPSRETAFKLRSGDTEIAIVLLSHEDSLRFHKTIIGGSEVVSLGATEAAISQSTPVPFTQIKPAGPFRTIKPGHAKVSEAPSDEEFKDAAVWKIDLPTEINGDLLRVKYLGDVARIYVDGKFITDNFYNSRPFDLSLRSVKPSSQIELHILPLQKDAPIYLDDRAKPDFGNERSILRVESIELIKLQNRWQQ